MQPHKWNPRDEVVVCKDSKDFRTLEVDHHDTRRLGEDRINSFVTAPAIVFHYLV